ncbi:7580_t:CDS:2 [Dentiscutata erythropus]|uniref:7580_t:CDS:1 n=1 Tax=Dentiscutata erythropus TaxID=1348616 RepID=A0A9N9C160_9GLOM|nr:7580_t:CDS:2 [Dentiscutata erythropus]
MLCGSLQAVGTIKREQDYKWSGPSSNLHTLNNSNNKEIILNVIFISLTTLLEHINRSD